MNETTLKEHLQFHKDVLDEEIKLHRKLLVGPNEDNGLCADVKELQTGFKSIKTAVYAVGIPILVAIVGDIVARVVK